MDLDNTTSTSTTRPQKRRREDTEDGEVVAKTSISSSRRSAVAPASAWSFKGHLPPRWRSIFDAAAEDGDKIPPPTCITKFVEIHAGCLGDFRDSQQLLQKALLTLTKHEQNSSNGAIPTTVSNNLRLPYVQLVKSASSAGDDADVCAEKERAEKQIAEAAATATSYLGKLYAHQVQLCKQQVNTTSVSVEFSRRLQAYAKPIITAGGGEDDTAWDTVIALLTDAIADELLSLNFEFVAVLDREAEAKEAKATAVVTARADAEMADATKPVKELVQEAGAHLEQKLTEKLTKLISEKLPTPDQAASSSNASSSKPGASSSKTKTPKVPSNKAKDTNETGVPPSKRAQKKLLKARNVAAAAPGKSGARTEGKPKLPKKDKSKDKSI